ncbi:hypothetical protein, partial [Roseinatronobacter sp. NSM]|uniref:hypothetical protein n=1 Tax=Roseinatronobacter sp. NSM TaxID=3457785 RepID=UPI004037328E
FCMQRHLPFLELSGRTTTTTTQHRIPLHTNIIVYFHKYDKNSNNREKQHSSCMETANLPSSRAAKHATSQPGKRGGTSGQPQHSRPHSCAGHWQRPLGG